MSERLNEEAVAALRERAGDGPVVMLNLLAFKPDGGAERYAAYGAAVAPLLERVGGRPIHVARSDGALIGDGSWDMVMLVEYPTRAAFLEMVTSPEYGEISHLRTEALERSELHPLDPVDLSAL